MVDNAPQTTSPASPSLPYSPGHSSFPKQATIYGTLPTEFATWQQDYVSMSPYSAYMRTATHAGPASSHSSGKEESGVIYEAMKKWGFEYEPVSELDSDSSAYTAAFWDKNSNWVVVAFKGKPDREL